jgi:hypothetical protein
MTSNHPPLWTFKASEAILDRKYRNGVGSVHQRIALLIWRYFKMKKPKGFRAFDQLARELVKVPKPVKPTLRQRRKEKR